MPANGRPLQAQFRRNPMTEQLTPDQLRFLVQFIHPDKTLPAQLDTSAARIGPLFDPGGMLYEQLVDEFAANARRAAEELLADPAFAAQIDRLPFAPGSTVVGLGDSITDDYQSWLEILRHVLAMRRPGRRHHACQCGRLRRHDRPDAAPHRRRGCPAARLGHLHGGDERHGHLSRLPRRAAAARRGDGIQPGAHPALCRGPHRPPVGSG